MRNLNALLNYLIAAVVILIAGSFFYLKDKAAAPSGPKLSSSEVDKVVNKYIRETSTDALRQRLVSEKALIEARKKITELNKLNKIKEQKEIESIPAEKQIWKESEVVQAPERVEAMSTSTSSMTAAEKKEYARQYIENARSGGYAIELSEDLEVIKVTPLRKPSQESDSYEAYPSN